MKYEYNRTLSKVSFDEYHSKCLDEFKNLETEQSDINVYNFVVANYKDIRLFGFRPYPRPYFFYIVTQKNIRMFKYK